MKTLSLAANVSATAVANQASPAASNFTKTPFLAGREAVVSIDPIGATGTPTFKVQGSDDNSTWVDLHTSTLLGRSVATITLRPFNRFAVTVAASAGTVSATLLADN